MPTKQPLFSIITPTNGKRPNALYAAIASIQHAAATAGLTDSDIEMLIGFDGIKAALPQDVPSFVKAFSLPADNDWGNGIRKILLKAAKGTWLIFVDDDNYLMPDALSTYMQHPDVELIIARIDTSRAFSGAQYLPQIAENETPDTIIRHTNIDPLCICVRHELAQIRCSGWNHTGYAADYLTILQWYRRARGVAVTNNIVGIYDYGSQLDGLDFTREEMDPITRREIEKKR